MVGMSEDEINRRVSNETTRTSASVGLNVDMRSMESFHKTIQSIKREANELRDALTSAFNTIKTLQTQHGLTFEGMASDTGNGFQDVVSGGGGGGGRRARRTGNLYSASEPEPIRPTRQPATEKIGIGDAIVAGSGGATPIGGSGALGALTAFGKTGGYDVAGGFAARGANFAGTATALYGSAINAIDNRVASGRDYALSADKLSVMLQQTTGASQQGVMNMRAPLTDYRLGANGINQLLSLQARTGINALQQASSVEAMRTLSGFTMDAGGATSIIESLASPETVNRMFMMTGTSLVGPGGQIRDTKSLMQDLVKKAGLTDPRLAKSAIAPGSITRANLSQMGITGDLQDQVIQYAQSNIEFQKKGGRGMYDPSKKEDRKRMGIEDNFATQEAETERVRGKRDEQFYRDQAKSYASLEKQTQSLTQTFAKLEHSLKGLISARTENRLGMKLLGGAMMLGGAIAAPFSGGLSAGLIGMGAATFGSSGDGMDPNRTDYGGRMPMVGDSPIGGLSDGGATSSWGGLKPVMKERMTKLANAAARDGISLRATSGVRSSKTQEAEFLRRYDVTKDPSPYKDPADGSTKKPIQWGGVLWKKVAKAYDMAPPGRSMHEIGLAVDLDLTDPKVKAWVKRNLATYGLRDFEKENGEAHHIQPSDIPGARVDYEKQGAKYGTEPAGMTFPQELLDAWGVSQSGSTASPITSTESSFTMGPTAPPVDISAPPTAAAETTYSNTNAPLPSSSSSTPSLSGVALDLTGDGITYSRIGNTLNSPLSMSRSFGGTTVNSAGNTFNMPITFQLSTTGKVSEVDIREMAKKVANHIEKEVNLKNIRSW